MINTQIQNWQETTSLYIGTLNAYFFNNRKRVFWAWVIVHIFFLFVGVTLLSLSTIIYGTDQFMTWAQVFGMVSQAIFLFPVLIIGLLGTFLMRSEFFFNPVFIRLVVFLYYCLFFLMIFFANDTQKTKFTIVKWVFLLWFLGSLFISLFITITPFYLLPID